jgi:hypothetical protein
MVRCLTLLLVAFGLLTGPAFGMASHYGWPPREPGMLLMNKTDSARPLSAREGLDPFDGQDKTYSCDELGEKPTSSCVSRFEADLAGITLPLGVSVVTVDMALAFSIPLKVKVGESYARLYGGHGDDTIHGGPYGDVLWGDYKPTNQTTKQTDLLDGGDGPDFIYPSHGKNVVTGGPGNDVIHAFYGRGTIDCGPGRDAVYIPHPRKRYRYRNCEWKKYKTGESAPKWYLRKLPWPLAEN